MNDNDQISGAEGGLFEPVEFVDAGFRFVSIESAILLGGIILGIIAGIWHLV